MALHLGCHVSVDWVKIGLGAKTATGAKLRGQFCIFFILGGQNRNFGKVRGLKLLLSQKFIIKKEKWEKSLLLNNKDEREKFIIINKERWERKVYY